MMTDEEFQHELRVRLVRMHEANAQAAEHLARKAQLEAEVAEMQRDAVRKALEVTNLKTPSTAPGGVS